MIARLHGLGGSQPGAGAHLDRSEEEQAVDVGELRLPRQERQAEPVPAWRSRNKEVNTHH